MGTSELDIKMLSLEEAWNVFKVEIDMNDDIYNRVRFGVDLDFDINDFFNNNIHTKPKAGKVIIYGKAYPSQDFYTELEMREREMKGWLAENLADDENVVPRTKGGKR